MLDVSDVDFVKQKDVYDSIKEVINHKYDVGVHRKVL